MVNGIDPVSGSNEDVSKTTASKSANNNIGDPDTFRIMMEQMTNQHINGLFSASSNSDNEDGSSNSFLGGSDFLSGAAGAPASPYSMQGYDPVASFLSSTNKTGDSMFDLSLLSPTLGMNEVETNKTLQKLVDYSDISETLKWAGKTVVYLDSVTGLAKEGKIEKVLIENVKQPVFVTSEGDEVNLDAIKEIANAGLSTDVDSGGA